jgi:tripartite motif-containing protein 71
VAPNGDVYVSDIILDRILKFSKTGDYLGQWGEAGSDPGTFISPTDVAVARSSQIYVADANNHRIQQFTAQTPKKKRKKRKKR